MDAVGIIGLAASISLLSGWRLYLCVFATGLAMHFGWIALPHQLHSLDVLANWWVIGAAGVGALAEFFADKVMWIDSAWDAVHTLVRPIGGALLALAIVDPHDAKWQVIALLLGGGAALLTHGAKAGTRAAVNASPEPFSNIAVSAGEDVATTGLLVAAIASPWAAAVIAVLVLGAAVAMLLLLRHAFRRLFPKKQPPAST
jgi:hypothetical protein